MLPLLARTTALENYNVSTNKEIAGFNAKQSVAKYNHSCLTLIQQLKSNLLDFRL